MFNVLSGLYMDDIYYGVYDALGDVLDMLSLLNCAVNLILSVILAPPYRYVHPYTAGTYISIVYPVCLQTCGSIVLYP